MRMAGWYRLATRLLSFICPPLRFKIGVRIAIVRGLISSLVCSTNVLVCRSLMHLQTGLSPQTVRCKQSSPNLSYGAALLSSFKSRHSQSKRRCPAGSDIWIDSCKRTWQNGQKLWPVSENNMDPHSDAATQAVRTEALEHEFCIA